MKSCVLFAFLLFMVPDTGKTLEDYRWKNRLVILNFSEDSIDSLLMSYKEHIDERKLLFIAFQNDKFIKSSGKAEIESTEFLEVLYRTDPISQWVLIGLDGGVKASGSQEEFSLNKIFRLIDQMPMRQSEIDRGI